MSERMLNEMDGAVLSCPQCQNLMNSLMVHTDFINEEVSKVWVQCECGFKPSAAEPVLDIFDTLGSEKVGMAISAWNESIRQ